MHIIFTLAPNCPHTQDQSTPILQTQISMNQHNASTYDHYIGIIGTGFGGLGAAIRLLEQGYKDIIILEKAKEVGGTWRENRYPGCACDIPSHVYSYSFELNKDWSASYAGQAEILDYLKHCTQKYQLEQYIEYEQEITHIQLDEKQLVWELQTAAGRCWRVKLLLTALGPLHVPKFPALEGREDFQGLQVHSAQWQEDIDLKGKRVAVVGTGASAIQIVPSIADQVADLKVFQRTPPWVFPKSEAAMARLSQKAVERLPLTQQLVRSGLYWFNEYAGRSLFKDNYIRKITQQVAERHLLAQVPDPELRQKLRPNYSVGCKRRLPSDDYYPTFQLPHVHLVTDGIQRITAEGLEDDQGRLHEVDVIIYATGFHVSDFRRRKMQIIGRGGKELLGDWTDNGAEAYFGTTIAGYPGLFYILGPNTGLGHNSMIHMMESQFNYILSYLKHLKKQPKGSLLDVRPKAQAKFNTNIQRQLAQMVWSDGSCSSWYLDAEGRNRSMWPGHTSTYRRLTKQIQPKAYQTLTPERSSQSS